MLEKETLPRYKPCGGGVSPVVAQWFDFNFSPAISLKISRISYTFNKSEPVSVDIDSEPIWMVRRDIFDHFLIQQAVRQGASLQAGCAVSGLSWQSDHWQIETDREPVAATYVIAADGAKGKAARWLGFRDRKSRPGGAIEAEAGRALDDPAAQAAHFEFGLVKNGYIWNFPKADGYSIGIGTFRGGDRQPLQDIASSYAELFGVNFASVRKYGHPLCLWDGDQALHTQNALLAGEAACVVDPFTAEGIRPAIFSGIQAARAIDKALSGAADALAVYSQTLQHEWGSDMVWAQRLASVFYRFPKAAYTWGIKTPSATRTMARILSGELRYREVAGKAIQKLSRSLLPGS